MDKVQSKITLGRTHFLDLIVRAVLLVVIALQLLFLSSREFRRIDLTADRDFTLTKSTRRLLANLEDRVLVRAFFTRDVPPIVAPVHERIRALLQEYQARSNGKLIVEYVDPDQDQALRDEADRLGIAAAPLSSATEGQLSVKRVYQGLRIRSRDAQKTLDLLRLVLTGAQAGIKPSQFEFELTNALAELVVKEKPKVVLSAKAELPPGASPFQQPQQGGTTYNNLKSAIEGRFVVQELDFGPGDKLPENTALFLLVKPKDLGELQRFELDQYLVKGGKVILFVDQNEFTLGRNWKRGEIETGLEEFLAHHGVLVRKELLADMGSNLPMTVPQYVRIGGQMVRMGGFPIKYPYWVIARNVDYAKLGQEYADALPGMNPDEAAVSQLESAFFFWAVPVRLKEELPAGLRGVEFIRSSPVSFVEQPIPHSVDPGMDEAAIRTFQSGFTRRLATEKGRQYPLVVSVSGRFHSFFKGRPLPEPPPEESASEFTPHQGFDDDIFRGDRDGVPLQEPEQPVTPATEAQEPEQPPVTEVPQADPEPGTHPADLADPEQPETRPAVPPAPKRPPLEFVERTDREGTLVVVGDATFLEDTLFTEQQGAIFQASRALVLNLVDSLALDSDLVDLRARNTKLRRIELVEPREGESPDRLDARRRQKVIFLQWVHRLSVPIVLFLFGIGVALVRGARKRSFIQSLG